MKTAKSVMLALQCKHTEVVDVKGPLLSYIRATYSDKEADDAAEDLTMIQQLRTEATSVVTGGTPGLKEAQAKYESVLEFFIFCMVARPMLVTK
jgi:programmed cell death 6-interacting protein